MTQLLENTDKDFTAIMTMKPTKFQIAESFLRKEITRGRWKPGEKLPNERELSIMLNVSRTLTRDILGALASEGLVDRVAGSGTYLTHNPIRTNIIVILVEYWNLMQQTTNTFNRMVDLALKSIISSGYQPMLEVGHGTNRESFLASLNIFDTPITNQIKGVINFCQLEYVSEELLAKNIQTVNIGAYDCPSGISHIKLDFDALIKIGKRQLLRHGYEDYTVMAYYEQRHPVYEDMDMTTSLYPMLMTRHFDADFLSNRLLGTSGSLDLSTYYNDFVKWWNSGKRTKALFLLDDGFLYGISRAISELNIRIPEDLAIISQTISGLDYPYKVNLCCLDFDVEHNVELGWNLLSKLIDGRIKQSQTILVPPSYIDGNSL